jgi:hypothetical protein
MILKKDKNLSAIKTNVKQSKGGEIKIAEEAMAKIADHMTKNLYSNIHGSIIREYVSNAYDAHIDRAKAEFIEDGGHSPDYNFSRKQIREFSDNMRPIHVKINRDGQGHFLSIRDFGLGMNEYQIDRYFRHFGLSSKDTKNDELGAFGVGSKSFQTYTQACYYSTIHHENGQNIQREFVMMATEGLPRFEPLTDGGVVTTDDTGTTVKMYIQQHDIRMFAKEAQEQLLYFKKVFFDIEGFNNDYKIFETDKFMYSDTEALNEVHAVLGVVAYPIDFAKIGLDEDLAYCPIGVKFEVGDFGVTLSREEIRYAPETKKLIKQKVEDALLEAVGMYNDTMTDGFKTLVDYARHFNHRQYNVMMDDTTSMTIGEGIIDWARHNHGVDIQPVVVHEYPKFDFTRFKEKSGFQTLMRGIRVHQYLSKDTVRLKKNPKYSYWNNNNHWKINQNGNGFAELFGNDHANSNKIVYFGTTDVNPTIHQVRHCYDTHKKDGDVWLIKGYDRNNSELSDNPTDWGIKHFATGLGFTKLTDDENAEWFKVANATYKQMRSVMATAFTVMDKIALTADRKKELREKYTESRTGTGGRKAGTVTIYEYAWNRLIRPTNNKTVKVADLDTEYKDKIVVYVDKKDAPHGQIEPFFRERHWRDGNFKDKYKVIFIAVSKSNMATIATMPNSYTLDAFFKGKEFVDEMAVLKNRALGQGILKEIGESRFEAIDKVLGSKHEDKYHELMKYKSKTTLTIPWQFENRTTTDEFFKLHPKKKDEKYLKECLELSKIYSTLDFIRFFNTHEVGCKEVIKQWANCKGLSIKGLNK